MPRLSAMAVAKLLAQTRSGAASSGNDTRACDMNSCPKAGRGYIPPISALLLLPISREEIQPW